MADPHLISVDELRAAGALKVPAAWRKSLSTERDRAQRNLFSDLQDEPLADEQAPQPVEADRARRSGCV